MIWDLHNRWLATDENDCIKCIHRSPEISRAHIDWWLEGQRYWSGAGVGVGVVDLHFVDVRVSPKRRQRGARVHCFEQQ